MKRRMKWIPVLCLLLAVLTVGSTFARYATTLSDSFRLNILAKLYTITYDANGGTFADGSETKKVDHVKRNDNVFTVISDTASHQFFKFLGWTDDYAAYAAGKTDHLYTSGSEFVATKMNTTLTAVWDSNFNDKADGAITDFVVDGNNISFVHHGVEGCEFISVPINDLDVGADYILDFDFYYVPKNGIGFYTGANAESIGSHAFSYAIGTTPSITHTTEKLGYFKNCTASTNFTHRFTASQAKMFLNLMTCDIGDQYEVAIYIKNLTLTKVMPSFTISSSWPEIKSAAGVYTNVTPTSGGVAFDLQCVNGIERSAIKLENLVPGKNYTVSFDFENNVTRLINNNSNSYEYQFGYCFADDTANIHTNPGYTWSLFETNGKHAYTQSFTATGKVAYLILNFSNVSDQGSAYHFELSKLTITEGGTGGSLLHLIPGEDIETSPIDINIDGIDDTHMDWMPISDHENMMPYPGEDYQISFTPDEGYSLADTITVDIDGTLYTVNTNGDNPEGHPDFAPETGILTIPAALLTEDTRVVTITAAAVPVRESAEPDPTETQPPVTEVDPTDPGASQTEPDPTETEPDPSVTEPEPTMTEAPPASEEAP